MKALILAAGYGTRLYPLTKDTPKPLLVIKNKPILEYILKNIEEAGIAEVYIITNDRFFEKISRWVKEYKSCLKIKVIDDHTTSNDDRLGAIKDIEFTISQEQITDDILVIAGDNLFNLSLKDFIRFSLEKQADAVVCAYDVKDIKKASLYGITEIDKDKRVVSFEEKPKEPKSTLAAMAIYYFPKKTLTLISEYLSAGEKNDAPGFFLKWLSRKGKVFAYVFDGRWFDIGSIEAYEEAQRVWSV